MLRIFKLAVGALALLLAGAAATAQIGWSGQPVLAHWMQIEFSASWNLYRDNERVIIRIPPKPAPSRRSDPTKWQEKKIGKCILMDRLIGSRPGPKESLEILTRDGNVIRAYLGEGCLAREFYAGAYVERSADGKLCIDRDLLHARTGAQCEIDKFRLLVPE
jgi:hypothetical protein